MQLKYLTLSALASLVAAQGQDLNATLAGNNQTSSLSALLGTYPQLTGSLANLKNITVLAPSNNAIGTLVNSSMGQMLTSNPGMIQALLQYHVLNGTYPASAITNMSSFVPTALMNMSYTNVTGGQRVEAIKIGNNVMFYSGLLQNATVVQPDVNFTGGVIHVIDHVLTLPANVSATLDDVGLTSLYGALNASNLLDTANGLQNVTIFAPNNSAFQEVGSGLANLSTTDLTSILTYHVIAGQEPMYSTDLKNGSMLPTVNGANLNVHIGSNNNVFINGAKIVTPNVLVAGGVVHVIDNVLNPNNTAAAAPTASSGTAAFSGASSVSNVPFTTAAPAPSTTVAGGGASSAATAHSSSSKAAAAPMKTGAIGVAALFGAGAAGVLAQV